MFFEPKHDTDYKNNIVCPYCGHEHSDSWEMVGSDDYDTEVSCHSCGREFNVSINRSVDYSSSCLPNEHVYIHTPSDKSPDLWRCENCGDHYFARHHGDKPPVGAKKQE